MRNVIPLIILTGFFFFLGKQAVYPGLHSSHRSTDSEYFNMAYLPPIHEPHFPVSGQCAGCHDADTEGIANVDADGNDVNVFDQWAASIMGQSAKDPYWRAKVRHETHNLPVHADAIENKCTSCHAPAGHYQAFFSGIATYGLNEMYNDSLGLDGVSCGACHQISRENFGTTFSGNITYDTNRVIYGPYPFPLEGPMRDFVGFTPKFSEHITASEACAPCHTLATTVFDPEGQPTNQVFVEQATYHEWLNSSFAQNQVTCQTCHMPYIEDSVIIASGYEGLEKRFPYALHTFSGANTMMLGMMKSFGDSLDIDVADSMFQKSILSTRGLLQRAVQIEVLPAWLEKDSVVIPLRIVNRAGHKFPSGYPSRRAWLEISVSDENGMQLIHSGSIRDDFSLAHLDIPYESHYDTIRNDGQVQVYEGVMVDLEDQFTTVLDKGARYIKDNRIPPTGFLSSHPVADTARIEGKARQDANFNFGDGTEGSGTDDIFIKVPSTTSRLTIDVKMQYQSIPPEWLQELFSVEGYAEIDLFKWMYDSIQPVPELVTQVMDTIDLSTTSTGSTLQTPDQLIVFPNPASAGQMLIFRKQKEPFASIRRIMIFDIHGTPLFDRMNPSSTLQVPEDLVPGMYILRVMDSTGRIYVKKLIIQDDQ